MIIPLVSWPTMKPAPSDTIPRSIIRKLGVLLQLQAQNWTLQQSSSQAELHRSSDKLLSLFSTKQRATIHIAVCPSSLHPIQIIDTFIILKFKSAERTFDQKTSPEIIARCFAGSTSFEDKPQHCLIRKTNLRKQMPKHS